MSSTAEDQEVPAMAADAATEAAPETQSAKPARERKPRVPMEKKPRTPKSSSVSHPPYFQMIKEALLALQEKGGSSSYAIAKYMEEKHKANLPANFRKTLTLQLKNFTTKGKLTKIKASFKLATEGPTEKPARKPSSTKAKASKPVKKAGAAKKLASTKPKQPKSIKSAKSPATVKKTRKAA